MHIKIYKTKSILKIYGLKHLTCTLKTAGHKKKNS